MEIENLLLINLRNKTSPPSVVNWVTSSSLSSYIPPLPLLQLGAQRSTGWVDPTDFAETAPRPVAPIALRTRATCWAVWLGASFSEGRSKVAGSIGTCCGEVRTFGGTKFALEFLLFLRGLLPADLTELDPDLRFRFRALFDWLELHVPPKIIVKLWSNLCASIEHGLSRQVLLNPIINPEFTLQ